MSSRGQPQYVVQLSISAHLPGRPCCRPVVLAQELVMKTYGQHAQDLDRIVGVKVMYWLSAHTPAGYQRAQTVSSTLEASAWSCQLISLRPARRASAKPKCGSQSGSQQAQTPGHVWQPPANIAAGQRHIWATLDDFWRLG
jgi:hypothetical protein